MSAELYNVTSRNLVYQIPSFFTLAGSLTSDLGPAVVVNNTAPDAIYYNISISDFGSVLDTYTMHLITKECKSIVQGEPQ